MITRVQIKNFKSIGERPYGAPGVDIELKPLTFLVGPNGGGKSSILEAIALFFEEGRRTPWLNRDQPGNPDPPLLPYFNPNDLEAVIHRQNRERYVQIGMPLDIPAQGAFKHLTRLDLYAGSRDSEHFDPQQQSFFHRGSYYNEIQVYLHPSWRGNGTQNDSESEMRRLVDDARRRVHVILAPRGQPSRYKTEDVIQPRDVGPYGEHLEAFLSYQHRLPPEQEERYEEVIALFGKKRPLVRKGGHNTLEDTFEDLHFPVRLPGGNLASHGARQAHVIIAQVCWSNPDSLTMIEEPEISLHPEAQVEMCRFLAENAAKGNQILATTHSQFMLLALRKPISEGKISADQVAVYHVERNKDRKAGEVGATVAERLPLTKEGYLENWIPSFSKVERELARDWVEALQRAEKGE